MTNISSMTGFSNENAITSVGTLDIYIRTVNSRFLEISLKIPEEMNFLEGKIRELISSKIARGKVDCRFTLHTEENELIGINTSILEKLLSLQSEVLNKVDAKELTVNEILSFPGILHANATDPEKFSVEVLGALEKCLNNLTETRKREGESLGNALLKHCDEIDNLLKDLTPKLPEILEALKTKLQKRLNEALADSLSQGTGISKDEISERIRQEITVFGMRMDVNEEMERLATHLKEVRRVLAKGGAVGRRLDFLMQEMNREANTLGSKAASIEMSDTSVNLKLAIESMREQIQNLE